MTDLAQKLAEVTGDENVLVGEAISEDFSHDESLASVPQMPALVVRPGSGEEVAAILRIADETRTPVVARGSGSGLSGGATPTRDSIVISFDRMTGLEIDTENHVAVAQPGVTLHELDRQAAEHGLVYPVYPGEMSATIGGNIATNAGGMRAVRYGVTRENVLGLRAALPSGEMIQTGGRVVKISTGYDLTQLITGSEGTLALITEATLKLQPRLKNVATLLAPFSDLDAVTAAVPKIIASGIAPVLLEYLDGLTMAAVTYTAELELGIPDEVRESAQAYLVVQVAERRADAIEQSAEDAGLLLAELGATDVYVLPGAAAAKLIDARERAFWSAKTAGANDVVDVVVPRAQMPEFLSQVRALAAESESVVVGAGHAGDGNVHLAIFQPDPEIRGKLMHQMFEQGMSLGGMISAEHGIGREKRKYFEALEDPVKVGLMRGIKQVFDPNGILNPGVIFDSQAASA